MLVERLSNIEKVTPDSPQCRFSLHPEKLHVRSARGTHDACVEGVRSKRLPGGIVGERWGQVGRQRGDHVQEVKRLIVEDVVFCRGHCVSQCRKSWVGARLPTRLGVDRRGVCRCLLSKRWLCCLRKLWRKLWRKLIILGAALVSVGGVVGR